MKIIQIQRQKRTGLVKISLTDRELVNQDQEQFDLLGVIDNDNLDSICDDLIKFKICDSFYYINDEQVADLLK